MPASVLRYLFDLKGGKILLSKFLALRIFFFYGSSIIMEEPLRSAASLYRILLLTQIYIFFIMEAVIIFYTRAQVRWISGFFRSIF